MSRSATAVFVVACLAAAAAHAASADTGAPAALSAPAKTSAAKAPAAPVKIPGVVADPDVPAQIWGVGASPYPPEARKLNQEGDVVVSVLVGEDGKVRDARVKTSSGFPLLDDAAVKLFKTAVHYSPAIKNGKPVTAWIDAKTGFHLAEAEGQHQAVAGAPTACYDLPVTRGFLRPDMQGNSIPYRQILIDEKGTILQMSAWVEGRWEDVPAQDVAALSSQLRFQPGLENGQPVKCWFDLNKPAPRKEEKPVDALGPEAPAAAPTPQRGGPGGGRGGMGGGMGGMGGGIGGGGMGGGIGGMPGGMP